MMIGAAIGVLVGLVVMGALVFVMMPKMMLIEQKSKLGFAETVKQIKESAENNSWSVPKIYEMDEAFQKAGYKDVVNMAIVSLCQPHYAHSILINDVDKRITAIMPCRIGVYEKSDGGVYVTEMNIGMMSKMFGGNIAKVMGGVASEEEEMFKHIFS